MKELQNQVKELCAIWKRAYESAMANPTAWQPYLPNTSIVVLDEVIDTVQIWLDRSKAPTGFSPGFHLAKSIASIYLPQLLTTAQNLEGGQYNHLPNFVNGLINILAALHTMAVYSQKEDVEHSYADISAELSQALSLLTTAQSELAEKKKLLESIETLAKEIEDKHTSVTELEKSATSHASEISDQSEVASSQLQAINDTLESVKAHKNELTVLLENNKKLDSKLSGMIEELTRLQVKCVEQEKIIDSILPRGASAGLAAAFSTRGGQLEIGKWIWMGIFVASLMGLSIFAWKLTSHPATDLKDFSLYMLIRLPLAAPLIWLGWFSAIQYGNTIRVQEDYAFKEATSKAFQGYRDHMENLANVELDEAQTALNLLSVRTIEILAHEPLRIYSKTEHDATPTHGLASMFHVPAAKKPEEK